MPTLTAPSQAFFLVSLALAIIAILGVFVLIPYVTQYAFWISIIAFAVLAAACLNRGM